MSVENITSIEDLLFEIQNYTDEHGVQYPQVAHLLPSDDQIVDIDLNTREIKAPKFLSVQYDHNAEVIYFRCARYVDGVDLAKTICIVQYTNAEHIDEESGRLTKNSGLYWVPLYDIYNQVIDPEDPDSSMPVLIFPWAVGGLATAYEGTVSYSVRFFRLDNDGRSYIYNMSTRPAQGDILYGMDLEELKKLSLYTDETIDGLLSGLSGAIDTATTYWVDAEQINKREIP